MPNSGSAEDRLAIRELVETYNDAVMRFDGDAWAATWMPDATWELPGAGAVTGRDAILAAWQHAMTPLGFVGFFAHMGPMHVDGDSGRGTVYQQEFLHYRDGRKLAITGEYRDVYTRRDGQWRFQERRYRILDSEERQGDAT